MTSTRQKQYDKVYMQMALAIAKLSYAYRNKVGCIIVSKNGQVISQGFNGTPTGYDNCCENAQCTCKNPYCTYSHKSIYETLSPSFCTQPILGEGACKHLNLITKHEVLHAESNAISKCAKWISSTEDATLYVTLSPCFECSKIIIQAGITRVCYKDEYRDTSGIDFLKKNGIMVERIEI